MSALNSYIAGVEALANKADREHGPFVDRWHALGVLLEERDEFFAEVKCKERNTERLLEEVFDIAAVVLCWCSMIGGDREGILENVEERLVKGPPAIPNAHAGYAHLTLTIRSITAGKSDYDVMFHLEALLVICGMIYLGEHERTPHTP